MKQTRFSRPPHYLGNEMASLNAGGRARVCHPLLGRLNFQKGYTVERERAAKLARGFRAIDKARPNGRTMHKAFVHMAWRWNGKPYACDPSRRMHCAEGTLRCLYYTRWLAGGRTAAALIRRWSPGKQKLSPALVIEFVKLCLEPGVASLSAAYRISSRLSASESAYRYAIPARLREALATLHLHRCREQGLLRKARNALERFAAEPGGSK